MKLYLYLKNGIPEIEASETPVKDFDLYELRKVDPAPKRNHAAAKPTFDQRTLLLEASDLDDGESHYLIFPGGDPVLSVEPAVGEPGELAARVAACVNACHGLDLPENLPPGILEKVVRKSITLSCALTGHRARCPKHSRETAMDLFRLSIRFDRRAEDAPVSQGSGASLTNGADYSPRKKPLDFKRNPDG